PVMPLTGKGVGGGTLVWTAVALRMHPSDFRARTLDGVGADWPLTFEELEPYFAQVEREFGIAGPREGLHGFSGTACPLPAHPYSGLGRVLAAGAGKLGLGPQPGAMAINSRAYQGRPACINCGFCIQGCISDAKASAANTYIPEAERAGARIVPKAFVHRLELDAQGRVARALYFDAAGREQEQRARTFVVTAHAIETPRLLLNSACGSFPQGLANSSGLVGRNFMVHPNVTVFGRFPFPLEAYRGFNLANLVVQDFYATDPKNGYARGFTLESVCYPPMGFAVTGSELWGAALKRLMRQYVYCGGFWVCGEGVPNERNTITLDPEVRDAFGVPVARITHEWSENDLAMLEASIARSREILEAAGAVEVFHGAYRSAHNMGTCRMGRDPATSVVTPDCRAHDVPNLYICDTSVFVTAGGVNPTLTAMAIAQRAADRRVEAARRLEL
ncbi:MAG: GMC family oxidoreductase, partial [Deltaproteobacteria bacterium]|nr:GMC family oxidoreductase [Deltaproteobacteria bacterium]